MINKIHITDDTNPLPSATYINTITALNEQIEALRQDKAHAVQQAITDPMDEIIQLRVTIAAQREEQDRISFENDKHVKEIIAFGNSENIQLK